MNDILLQDENNSMHVTGVIVSLPISHDSRVIPRNSCMPAPSFLLHCMAETAPPRSHYEQVTLWYDR